METSVEHIGSDRHIVLIGMMGSGKSTLGRLAAAKLRRPFFDADAVIEAESGMRIADIFRIHGEEEFRRREHVVLAGLVGRATPSVIATGGGAFCQEPVRKLLTDGCATVFLRVPEEELLRRLERDGVDERPLLASPEWRERVAHLVRSRYPLYAMARYVVDVREEEPERTVARLMHMVSTRHGENDGHT